MSSYLTPMKLDAAQLTSRWEILQQARHNEMGEITLRLPSGPGRWEMIQAMNEDPFWENIFNGLETQLREVYPDHPYLTENQISVN